MTVAPYFDCWWSKLPPWPIQAVISRERSIPSQAKNHPISSVPWSSSFYLAIRSAAKVQNVDSAPATLAREVSRSR